MQSLIRDAAWCRAVTLDERIASLRSASQFAVQPLAQNSESRQPRWSEGALSANPLIRAQRLASDGITEQEFVRLLDEPIESVRDRLSDSPLWLIELAHTFSGA